MLLLRTGLCPLKLSDEARRRMDGSLKRDLTSFVGSCEGLQVLPPGFFRARQALMRSATFYNYRSPLTELCQADPALRRSAE